MRRLNWGCGANPPPGWINADLLQGPGIDISRDIRQGLPLEYNSVRYIMSIHALQDLPYLNVVPALEELRRVLEPGGILRLSLPDLERAIAAYLRNDRDYFYIPERRERDDLGQAHRANDLVRLEPDHVHLGICARVTPASRIQRRDALRVQADREPVPRDRGSGQPRAGVAVHRGTEVVRGAIPRAGDGSVGDQLRPTGGRPEDAALRGVCVPVGVNAGHNPI